MDDGRGVELGGGHLPTAVAAWDSLAEASAKTAAAVPTLWELCDDQLVAVLVQEQAAAAQRDAARLAVLRELDRRGYAATAGAASTQAWLSHHLLVDPRAAAADVRAARQLDPDGDVPAAPGALAPVVEKVALPSTGRALLAGEISRPHADAVTAMVRALPVPGTVAALSDLQHRAEQWLLTQCALFTPADVRRLGLHLRHVIDPNGVLADERTAEQRAAFWVRADPDGVSYRFGGCTDSVTGAALTTFIDAHSGPRPRVYEHTGDSVRDARTPDQRRGHAFRDLVNLAVTADPAARGGLPTQLIVTTTLATLRAQLGERGVSCGTAENGQPLSAALTRKLACDTTLIPAVLGARSEVLDIGRATRTVSTALRRALVLRDRHCAFPSCDRPARWSDGHHIRHWADGGSTDLDNLVLLCGHHHDVLHHTPWTVRITDGRPVFTRPPTARQNGRPPPEAPT